MKKYFLITIIISVFQGCAVYDLLFTPTPGKVLTNNNFKWITDTTEQVNFHFEKDKYSENDIKIIKSVTQNSINKILKLINENRYPNHIEYIIVSSTERMKELTGYSYNAFSYPRLDAVYAIIGKDIRALGAHEFNHVIVENIWGKSEDWLTEGFAVFSDDDWHGNDLFSLSKYLFDKKKLLTFADLVNDFPLYSSLLTYPQCGSIVKYLYEKYGRDKFKLLWQNGSDSIEKIYGKKLYEIESDWQDEIQKHDAKKIKYDL